MKRKQKWLLFLVFPMLLLAGWGKKQVELLNDNKLIDLNKALEKCILGAEDLLPDEGENAQNPDAPSTPPGLTTTPVPTVQPTVTPAGSVTPKPTEAAKPKPRSVIISVRDCVITCGSVEWENMDELKERILRERNSAVTFRLVDDYAEAHVYRQLLKLLEELKAEYGISYIRD